MEQYSRWQYTALWVIVGFRELPRGRLRRFTSCELGGGLLLLRILETGRVLILRVCGGWFPVAEKGDGSLARAI
jgi:hypothetical protein